MINVTKKRVISIKQSLNYANDPSNPIKFNNPSNAFNLLPLIYNEPNDPNKPNKPNIPNKPNVFTVPTKSHNTP